MDPSPVLTFLYLGCRFNQEAIISASMDMRDIIVVAPTGAGKSLTYQLPALLMPGVTICITPLISLMQDQTYNLKKLHIEAEMIHAETNKQDLKEIMRRMLIGLTVAKGKGKAKELAQQEKEIKLVYVRRFFDPAAEFLLKLACIGIFNQVTPERIEKSKTFVSILQKLYDGGLLPRIIIDEAHCISSLGNDFRPAYQSKMPSAPPYIYTDNTFFSLSAWSAEDAISQNSNHRPYSYSSPKCHKRHDRKSSDASHYQSHWRTFYDSVHVSAGKHSMRIELTSASLPLDRLFIDRTSNILFRPNQRQPKLPLQKSATTLRLHIQANVVSFTV